MEPPIKADVLYRLACVQGHLRGVIRMVEADHPCPAILQQTRALQGSLREIGLLLVENHLDMCIGEGAREGKSPQQVKDELVAFFRLHAA
jgi:DNA-binding FrmR family transcriptional regulator